MSTLPFVSDTFDAARWRDVDLPGAPLTDMTFHRLVSRGKSDHAPAGEDLPVVRIAFDRPAIRNAFRPHTVDELYRCIDAARCTPDVAALILTGNGPSPRDGGYAFCSGGDQRIRGAAGYQYESQEASGDEDLATDARRERIEKGRLGRLHICLLYTSPSPRD